MRQDEHRKLNAGHLSRKAYLYVRQSTLRQVLENQESTRRQYALRERAVALGWATEDVVVIDSDLGRSGASAADRLGFQRLVSEVGLGHVGIVMGLEVSRLARNSADWHRLIEICALTSTLILDEDGLYDPAHFNDRLLLGLKGTMSEAELHVLRARLRGGVLSKARRGELEMPLPAGLIYTPDKQVVLDPDSRVQQTLRTFFATFSQTGSATATVKAFRQQQLLFPSRRRPHSSDILWKPLTHSRALAVLHNPRFAGAFAFGRTESRKTVDGRIRSRRRPREEWIALIPGTHPGYITWEAFEANQARLRKNSRAHGSEKRRGPAREGPALLQGLVMCGRCGKRMTVRYGHRRDNRPTPIYVCQRDGIQHGGPMCQHITGTTIDDAVGDLLIELMNPMSIDIAMAVQKELNARAAEIDRLRVKAIEQARYQADLARRRYMQVDPSNRLVADVLEAEWNNKLRALTDAQEELERRRGRHHATLSKQRREAVHNLVDDFPALWRDSQTPHRERKRLLRLLVDDVTLVKSKQLHVNVRLRGGQTRSLTLLRPLPAWALRKADPELVEAVDKLIEDHTDPKIAAILNERGHRSKAGSRLTVEMVRRLKKAHGLKSRHERLRARGLLTMQELAAMLGVATSTIKAWRSRGLVVGHASDGRGHYLYEDPGPNPPRPQQGRPRKDSSTAALSPT